MRKPVIPIESTEIMEDGTVVHVLDYGPKLGKSRAYCVYPKDQTPEERAAIIANARHVVRRILDEQGL